MTPAELLDRFRAEVADLNLSGDADCLWSDEEIYDYMDDAQKQFARETRCFVDSESAALTTVAVTANDPWVPLNPRIIRILDAHLVTPRRDMRLIKKADVSRYWTSCDYGNYGLSNWRYATGTPHAIITDMMAGKGRLLPIPLENDTIQFTVERLPLKDVTEESAALEVTERQHQLILIHWMKHRAYDKQDADTYDSVKSSSFAAQFRERCREIHNELGRLRRPAGTVRYGGY